MACLREPENSCSYLTVAELRYNPVRYVFAKPGNVSPYEEIAEARHNLVRAIGVKPGNCSFYPTIMGTHPKHWVCLSIYAHRHRQPPTPWTLGSHPV